MNNEPRKNSSPKHRRIRILFKQAFQKHLQRRYSLRLHMCVILLATTFSGVLFSKILLLLDLSDFRVRYPLVLVLSYLVFFACIRLWLSWIASTKESGPSAVDWIGLSTPSSPGGVRKSISAIREGAGQFSGAGASDSFDNPEAVLAQGAVVQDQLSNSGGGSSEGFGHAVGGAKDILGGDDSVGVAACVLVALVATMLISTVLVLYSAPTILAEAAFEGVLAASLIKRTRVISDKAWAGSILKATWKPFAATLVVAFLGGAILHDFYPGAVRLSDILWKG